MLPISWPVSVVLALFMTAIHIVYRIGESPDYAPNLPVLFGEIIMLASASVSGLYYRIMSDAAHTRTVDGTRTGIEQRVKLECEREQQEQLLLSVIPAYIAAEVKRSIMLKMADACQRAGGQTNSSATRFHELHVQRHNNVSILYADIVNFTPLSEQLTASDLVKTLNDLFGRFDQIAQNNEKTSEDIHLDDLYTRYRQRLRKSLFRSGLLISLAACVVSIIIGVIYQQQLLQTLLLALATLISASILTALQFPAVLNSPVAALAFAIVTTFSLGTIAAITGEELAPLPLFAVFLVSICLNVRHEQQQQQHQQHHHQQLMTVHHKKKTRHQYFSCKISYIILLLHTVRFV
ncbi:adenylate cyclase type 2-like [Lucilia cuprina]|uniref:adenylate cyclase type 2-like n=1 Tax=Lucilia cuprina TaxID=7375 RepID=UPI001F0552EC|nr:adenylate cyclase type 2-like [Lucilia cuprina]